MLWELCRQSCCCLSCRCYRRCWRCTFICRNIAIAFDRRTFISCIFTAYTLCLFDYICEYYLKNLNLL
ncbi:unnamed protein product [Meloidogyne enterolobii]|uniref:Uncharacterized protein n=1 Tax=Meloidogyne enterolobii TaxID=390850 RepID=A0ACB0ZXQ1_MELEN